MPLSPEDLEIVPQTDILNELHSFSNEKPRDFDHFKKQVLRVLDEFRSSYTGLRARFSELGSELDNDVIKIQTTMNDLQEVFDDFCTLFNSFTQRENALLNLNAQTMKKAHDLTAKMNVELMSATAQRS